jgi:hypothetical protein
MAVVEIKPAMNVLIARTDPPRTTKTAFIVVLPLRFGIRMQKES